MIASEWKKAWGKDRLIFLQGGARVLPLESRRFLKNYGLPRNMIFEGETPFEIHFDALSKDLVPYNKTFEWGDFYDKRLDRRWGEQLVIGEEDFCNGSASYCVHGTRGEVTRIDVELDRPNSFVNSSVAQFGRTLLAMTAWSSAIRDGGREPSQASLRALATRVKAIDPAAFKSRNRFWPYLFAYLREQDELESLEITSDPARSKHRF